MGTRLQNSTDAIFNAMDEARVQMAIRLYDSGCLKPLNIPEGVNSRWYSINYWAEFNGVGDTEYWLNYFGVAQ